MTTLARLTLTLSLFTVACGGSDTATAPDAATAPQACAQVGVSTCHQIFACYTASEIADLQYPPTEAGCVAEENAACAQAQPGFCKGSTQTSIANAEACAADLSAQTCTEFKGTPPANDVCKTALCSP